MPDTPTRPLRITTRYTHVELDEIKEKAGDQPLTTFTRDAVLAHARTNRAAPKRRPIEDHVAFARVLAMIGSSGLVGAFREAAKGVADGTLPTSDRIEELLVSIDETLRSIKHLLMQALGVAEQ